MRRGEAMATRMQNHNAQLGPAVRIRVPTFSFVYFSRGTLPQQKGKRAPLGDLVSLRDEKGTPH